MTNILPWLAANWLMLAIALTGLICVIAGLVSLIRALTWYLHTCLGVRHFGDPMAGAYGDVPHVREKAKRNAAIWCGKSGDFNALR